MTCPLEPIGPYVVVRQDAADDKTAGGIYLPDSAKRKQRTGVVLAVGELVPLWAVEVGDRILYFGESQRVDLGGVTYLAVHQDFIFARIAPDAPRVPEDIDG